MKKILLSFFLIFSISLNTNAQFQWNWVNQFNSSVSFLGSTKTVSDTFGNIYITGSFEGTVSFATDTITAYSTVGTDAFIVKYNSQGIYQWVKHYGYLNSTTTGNSICIDVNGDIYVCGGFTNNFYADSTYYTSTGQIDIFLLKLDQNGNFIRLKLAGGQSIDHARCLTTDPQGNIYLSGAFAFKSYFDNDSLMTGNSFTDIFIVKYDSSGNLQWLQKAGGTTDNDEGNAIHYVNGKLYVAGVIIGSCTFGTHNITASANDAFLARYDASNGNNIWVKKGGGSGNDYCYDMNVDSYGNAYLTGSIILNATFGTLPSLNAGNYPDAFVAKYDSGGVCIYAKKGGAMNVSDAARSISVDSYGYAIITGNFSNTALFGSHSVTSTAGGGTDIFVAKYDPTGSCQYAISAGGSGDDAGYSSAWLSNINEFVIVGNYDVAATFGPNSISVPTGMSYGSFIANLPGFSTAIPNIENLLNEIIVYPNPASNQIHIAVGKDAKQLKMINTLGQVAISVDVKNEDEIIIGVSDFKPGLYTLQVYSKNEVRTNKLQVIK